MNRQAVVQAVEQFGRNGEPELVCVSCRYKVVKQLGDGTYGSVWKAINNQTNDVVSPALSGSSTAGVWALTRLCRWPSRR